MMDMKEIKIKPKNIIWSDEKDCDESCRYNHVRGTSGLGEFLITWKGWKKFPSFDIVGPLEGFNDFYGCGSLNEAKEKANKMYEETILGCIESTELD